MKIFIISGCAGSGKSTLANKLANQLPGEVMSFADPIKQALASILWPEEKLLWRQLIQHEKDEPQEILGGRTVREGLQTLGTEWGRNMMDAMIWSRALSARLPKEGTVIIDDARFPNEVAHVHFVCKEVYHIHCDTNYNKEVRINHGHESELYPRILKEKADFVNSEDDCMGVLAWARER